MSAQALHQCTQQLPLVDVSQLAAFPPALGDSTIAAMRAGLAWGLLGSVRQLIEQLAGQSQAEVIVTGGGGRALAELLPGSARYVPHLTLSGIALAAEGMRA
jgi:type III pantothenate kinase